MAVATPLLNTLAQIWRRPYLIFLLVGLVAIVVRTFWPMPPGSSITTREVAIVSFVLAALAALWRMRPRPLLYLLGVLCLLLAFGGVWLSSPFGGSWVATYITHDPTYGPWTGFRRFGWLLLFFVPAWVLLAASVVDWRIAVASYLLPGAAFVLLLAATGLVFGTAGLLNPVVLSFLLLWPVYLLALFGMFGLAFF